MPLPGPASRRRSAWAEGAVARLPRLAVAGHAHLVALRGHPAHPIVVNDDDARHLLAALREAAAVHRVSIHAYALLLDQLHLLATPADSAALGRMVQDLSRRYVGAFNRRHRRIGALWNGRFRATVVQPGPRVIDAMVYVDQMPVSAGEAAEAAAYPWSSATHHLGGRRDTLVSDVPAYWQLGNTPFEREAAYARRLAAGLGSRQCAELADAAHKGWAIGDAEFVAALSDSAERPMRPRPRGRPRTG